jgi:hypothetical protein
MSVHRQVVERASRRQLITVDTSTTGVVNGSGWSCTGLVTWVSDDGVWMQFRAVIERTGAAVTVPADGNIADQLLVTLPTRCRGSSPWNVAVGTWGGRLAAARYRPDNGELHLTAVAPGANIATAEALSLGGFVVLDS